MTLFALSVARFYGSWFCSTSGNQHNYQSMFQDWFWSIQNRTQRFIKYYFQHDCATLHIAYWVKNCLMVKIIRNSWIRLNDHHGHQTLIPDFFFYGDILRSRITIRYHKVFMNWKRISKKKSKTFRRINCKNLILGFQDYFEGPRKKFFIKWNEFMKYFFLIWSLWLFIHWSMKHVLLWSNSFIK